MEIQAHYSDTATSELNTISKYARLYVRLAHIHTIKIITMDII